MKTMILEDGLYGALEAIAGRRGRPVQELANEAVASWLADAAMDEADYAAVERARVEVAKHDGAEFEALFDALDQDQREAPS